MDLLLLLRVGCFGIVSMTNAKDGKTMAMQVRFYTVDGTAGCTSGSKKINRALTLTLLFTYSTLLTF